MDWPEQVPECLRPFGFAGRPGDCAWPHLELAVTGHDDRDGVALYSIECTLVRPRSQAHWRVSSRLKRLHEELHDPIKKGLGPQVYAEYFGHAPFADKWGTAGTTGRLDTWCRALAFAVGCGAVAPPLLANALLFLEAPMIEKPPEPLPDLPGVVLPLPAMARRPAESTLPREQWVFFIRHAESRWNAAKENAQLVAMYREQDHGISERGREQAEQLRQTILSTPADGEGTWASRFWNAGMIFTSPLTRAIQTAVIALRDVLASGTGELVVIKAAREKRGLGGVDAAGVARGEAIREHVQRELDLLYPQKVNWEESLSPAAQGPCGCPAGPHGCGGGGGSPPRLKRSTTSEQRLQKRRSLLEAFDYIGLDLSDVQEKWWDSVVETPAGFRDRLDEFMGQLRSSGEENVIVVGHSLFFCAVFRTFTGEGRSPSRVEALGATLGREKLPNCGVLGLRVDWSGGWGPVIQEVVPMFGTQVPQGRGGRPSFEAAAGEQAAWVGGWVSGLKSLQQRR